VEKLASLSFYIVPVLISIIVGFGLIKKVNVFSSFICGAKEGLYSTFSITPALIGLTTAVSMLNASGFLDIFSSFISTFFKAFNFPSQVIPLMILRPISGSGSLAILDNILSNYGPDSLIGKIASVLMGSTETTFYTIAVYFGAINIKNFRHALPSALAADISSFVLSCVFVKLLLC